jgi:hypothetical protein
VCGLNLQVMTADVLAALDLADEDLPMAVKSIEMWVERPMSEMMVRF